MSTELTTRVDAASAIERVLIGGDLAQLKPDDRVNYYKMVCDSVGLNPLTKPFEYITLNGKLTLYARKDCTDQLRNIHNISVAIVAREVVDDCYVVTSRATRPNGRADESIGAVPLGNLKGDAKCNAMMKAETKSKRRVTLSICGLGMLDETEIETIPSARIVDTERTTAPRTFGKNKNGGAGMQPADEVATEVKGGPESPEAPIATAQHLNLLKYAHAPITPDPQLVEDVKASIEYIEIGKQKNFHKECRAAVRPSLNMQADDLTYTWLRDNGYVNKDGEPSAALIPASKWPAARDMAVKWLKVQ